MTVNIANTIIKPSITCKQSDYRHMFTDFRNDVSAAAEVQQIVDVISIARAREVVTNVMMVLGGRYMHTTK